MNVCTIKHRRARFAARGDTGRQRWMVCEADVGTTTAGGPFYYTAFGERCYYDTGASSWKIGGEFPVGSPRYMYDGGHGYENGFLALAGANSSLPAITLQHVGERWYESDIGRFVQKDPIGLGGGMNVYAYCISNPISLVDPTGCRNEAEHDVDDYLRQLHNTISNNKSDIANNGAKWFLGTNPTRGFEVGFNLGRFFEAGVGFNIDDGGMYAYGSFCIPLSGLGDEIGAKGRISEDGGFEWSPETKLVTESGDTGLAVGPGGGCVDVGVSWGPFVGQVSIRP